MKKIVCTTLCTGRTLCYQYLLNSAMTVAGSCCEILNGGMIDIPKNAISAQPTTVTGSNFSSAPDIIFWTSHTWDAFQALFSHNRCLQLPINVILPQTCTVVIVRNLKPHLTPDHANKPTTSKILGHQRSDGLSASDAATFARVSKCRLQTIVFRHPQDPGGSLGCEAAPTTCCQCHQGP